MTTRTAKGLETAKKIRQAILRIKKCRPKVVGKSRKMSVAAVAEESEVSRASIHKDYPELADQIKAEAGKDVRVQIDKKNTDLKAEKQKNRDLREVLTEAKQNNQKLVSINAALMIELEEFRSIAKSKNVIVINTKK
jgi:DNA-binding transcriptional MocR family regulator